METGEQRIVDLSYDFMYIKALEKYLLLLAAPPIISIWLGIMIDTSHIGVLDMKDIICHVLILVYDRLVSC